VPVDDLTRFTLTDAGSAERAATASRALRWMTEAVVLGLVCLAPWPFASVKPEHERLLVAGVAFVSILWGARMLLAPERPWRYCHPSAAFAALVFLALAQIVPLPRTILGTLAPSTARTYQRLLPSRPELLPYGEPRDDPIPPAGSTLSLYPAATRADLARLVALWLLFAALANLPHPRATLRRLSVAAFLSGSVLALFGLVQYFSTDTHTVFWSVKTLGQVFGPFVNRNHFAFYMNLCIFISTGWLLARVAGREQRPGGPDDTSPGPDEGRARPRPSLQGKLGRSLTLPRIARAAAGIDAETIGILFALALMVSSVLVCQSRGGFAALVGGSILGLALWFGRTQRSTQGWVLLVVPAVVLALVAWLGFDPVAERLGTFKSGEAVKDERLTFWSSALRQARDYPLWGTGFGTYQIVERLYRRDASYTDRIVEHTHNDYLELLGEAGLTGLVAIALVLFLLFRGGLRALRRDTRDPDQALVLGAVLGLAGIAIHSFSDFSLHMPADAVFATVLCGLLAACGRAPDEAATEHHGQRPKGKRQRGVLARAAGALVVIGLGLWAASESWKTAEAQAWRRMASDEDRATDLERVDRKLKHLGEALRLRPGDARLQSDAAYAHLAGYQEVQARWAEQKAAAAAGKDAGAMAGEDAVERLKRAHLVPALRHMLISRDLCPVRAIAQLDLATFVHDLKRADPQAAYLQRVAFLAPAEPWFWYQSGHLALADARLTEAWADWRRSLALSSLQLPQILEESRRHLDTAGLLRAVIPDRPELLLELARVLPAASDGDRRQVLERALAILERPSPPPLATDLHRRATIRRALGDSRGALEDYRAALLIEPGRSSWRYDRAVLLAEQGRFEEAHQEVLTILALEPANPQARALLDSVARGLAEHQ
jgi:O-antigen ligase/Flp pilus assembly protein TadD